jgi:hypothetical protein
MRGARPCAACFFPVPLYCLREDEGKEKREKIKEEMERGKRKREKYGKFLNLKIFRDKNKR